MTSSDQLPALFQLFTGYFNGDMITEFRSVPGCMAEFVQENPVRVRRETLDELVRARAGLHDEAARARFVDGLGSHLVPETTYQALLDEVEGFLRTSLPDPGR